jgi:hypothetical protein
MNSAISMSWSPAELYFLASVALVVAFFVISEMIETKRPRRHIHTPTESERLVWVLRHVPHASREALRKSRLASDASRLPPG